MFGFGVPELVIILVIVMVVFGAGRLPEIAGALGKSLTNFKKEVSAKDSSEGQAKTDNDEKKDV